MGSRMWSGRRRFLYIFILSITIGGTVFVYFTSEQIVLDDVDRTARLKNLWAIKQSMLTESDVRCNMPTLPVNSSIMMKFVKDVPPIMCSKGGINWAECKGHFCRLKAKIAEEYEKVVCTYKDVLWKSDFENVVNEPAIIKKDDEQYHLKRSDIVDVSCEGVNKNSKATDKWSGTLLGIRDSDEVKARISWDKPNGQAMRYNVLMFGFDSLSRNTFIRKLPNSHKVLTEDLKAYVLEGYNIVGDGTPQALIPILTGFSEIELPDTRKRMGSKASFVNEYPLIWYKFAENGYATAFLEDTPSVGIFTYRLKGFSSRPTDHYMRSYYVHTEPKYGKYTKYCDGDTPRHSVMLNYTRQFMHAYSNKPRFIFGFHGELSHDDYNLIQAADDDFAAWLKDLKMSGILDNTILIIMSDHGHRFASIRNTLQGKQEERLPWFSFVLPPSIETMRPGALDNMKQNTKRLTTPFDIHATLLDILGLNPNENYDIHSKFPPRSLSLFGPISVNRTCAKAWIEPHWCACLSWRPMPITSPFVQRLANHLVGAINKVVHPYSDRCATLTLDKIEWATSLAATDSLLSFKKTLDKDGFLPDLSAKTSEVTNIYQIKVRLMPGASLFEASLSHIVDDDMIVIKLSDISRINRYGSQARCIYDDNPQLRKYCFCTRD